MSLAENQGRLFGMSDEVLKDVTKPDVSSYENNGFGLGLDIVNRLCTKFGWQLTIQSTEGLGTRISLVF